MTRFRPCIDLHEGLVKQIVGGSLAEDASADTQKVQENFVSQKSASWFAEYFRKDSLKGGHVIKLGPGNDSAACEALNAWRGGLQIGGGVCPENAAYWLEQGASHVIVTSWLFDQEGHFLEDRLEDLVKEVGEERLVIDLSCRRLKSGGWKVAMNRWQTMTDLEVSINTLKELEGACAEFLIHAADVEGLCQGVDEDLVRLFADWKGIPITYAGGVRHIKDAQLVHTLSRGAVDLTVGSALDLFGGTGISYEQVLDWNQRQP